MNELFVWTVRDVIGLGALVLLVGGFIILFLAEKVMFFLERKKIISGKWRGIK